MPLRLLPLLLILFLAGACEETLEVPKPRTYPRVVYPVKEYVAFNEAFCDFTCEIPKYGIVEQDTLFFEDKARNDCWFNIRIPQLNAKIHCSYYPIDSRDRFDELVQDAFVMATKHNIKASYIEEIPVHRSADKVHGVIFAIEGPAASTYQFFVTDSTTNFLRGALYFDSQTRPDSLAPVIAFMKEDVNRLIGTLKWGK